MSVQWAQPYNGLITAVHLPAEIWRPNQGQGMDPGPAVIFNNNFAGPNYDRIDGWSFSHAVGAGATFQNVDTEILLPDWIRDVAPTPINIGIEFNFVTSGDSSIDTINMDCGCKMCTPAGSLDSFAWNYSGNISEVGAGAFIQIVRGPYNFNLVTQPNTVLRLRVRRIHHMPGNETWVYETFFLGATVYYKTA